MDGGGGEAGEKVGWGGRWRGGVADCNCTDSTHTQTQAPGTKRAAAHCTRLLDDLALTLPPPASRRQLSAPDASKLGGQVDRSREIYPLPRATLAAARCTDPPCQARQQHDPRPCRCASLCRRPTQRARAHATACMHACGTPTTTATAGLTGKVGAHDRLHALHRI